MGRGVVFGIVAGVAGAAAWAALIYFTHFEIGYLAWGIGFLVGAAMLRGGGFGVRGGIAAALISLASIAGGKFAATHLICQKFAPDPIALTSEESMRVVLVDEVVREREEAGTPITWPDGVDPDEASGPEDYPKDVWAEGIKRWEALDADAKEKKRVERRRMLNEAWRMTFPQFRWYAFTNSFDAFDLLFGAFAVFTAYAIPTKVKVQKSRSDEPPNPYAQA